MLTEMMTAFSVSSSVIGFSGDSLILEESNTVSVLCSSNWRNRSEKCLISDRDASSMQLLKLSSNLKQKC